jgi:hypothetical protein
MNERRRMLIKAVHDAAIELARTSRIESAAEGLDNKRPTPDEIRAFMAALDFVAKQERAS